MYMKLTRNYFDDDDGESFSEKLIEIIFIICPYVILAIIFMLVVLVFYVYTKMAADKKDGGNETDTLLA